MLILKFTFKKTIEIGDILYMCVCLPMCLSVCPWFLT